MSQDAAPPSPAATSAAQLRAEIEATRRALAEAADALAARAAKPTPEGATLAPVVTPVVETPKTVVPAPANLPVLYRAEPSRRRSVAVAGAVFAVAAMLVRRRLGR